MSDRKYEDIFEVCRDRHIDILCLTESWHESYSILFVRLQCSRCNVVIRSRLHGCWHSVSQSRWVALSSCPLLPLALSSIVVELTNPRPLSCSVLVPSSQVSLQCIIFLLHFARHSSLRLWRSQDWMLLVLVHINRYRTYHCCLSSWRMWLPVSWWCKLICHLLIFCPDGNLGFDTCAVWHFAGYRSWRLGCLDSLRLNSSLWHGGPWYPAFSSIHCRPTQCPLQTTFGINNVTLWWRQSYLLGRVHTGDARSTIVTLMCSVLHQYRDQYCSSCALHVQTWSC